MEAVLPLFIEVGNDVDGMVVVAVLVIRRC
jgi:hypothetical protein